MIGIPSLFVYDQRKRLLVNEYSPLGGETHNWVAVEMMPGADIRVTMRSGNVVRLEVLQRPNQDQKALGITEPWFRDATEKGPDLWLWKAVWITDLSNVIDGEWEGEAVGEGIKHNPLNLEDSTIVLSSLWPWREIIDVTLPPELGRVPLEYDDLRYYLTTSTSKFSDNAPMEGVVWWCHDTPIAQVRTRDFPTTTMFPNPEAERIGSNGTEEG